MITLTLKTDRPEACIGLYEDDKAVAHETWTAHRQLAETIHQKIDSLLKDQQKSWKDIQGIVVYKGPGSFTGLRIGLSVANALAYGQEIPIVAMNGEDWELAGIQKLQKGEGDTIALPEYGGSVRITAPRK